MKQYWVYILASQYNGTLYIGMTGVLARRIWEHKNNLIEGFTKEHGVHRLVYCEAHATPEEAARRERQMKTWNRQWKINLIEEQNPGWNDLYDQINQ